MSSETYLPEPYPGVGKTAYHRVPLEAEPRFYARLLVVHGYDSAGPCGYATGFYRGPASCSPFARTAFKRNVEPLDVNEVSGLPVVV